MSRIDWQAYLDGSMSGPEREAADRALVEDSAAQAELDELISFVSEIRRQGLCEEVPLHRLAEKIPQARKRVPIRWFAYPALAAALAIGAFMVFRPIAKIDHETVAMSSMSEAAAWVEGRNGIHLEKIPQDIGQLVASESSAEAGCFCLKIDGKLVHLGFMTSPMMVQGLDKKYEGGQEFLVGKGRVAFRSQGLYWLAEGDSNEAVWKVAMLASAQLRA